jgi:hypothetical protein
MSVIERINELLLKLEEKKQLPSDSTVILGTKAYTDFFLVKGTFDIMGFPDIDSTITTPFGRFTVAYSKGINENAVMVGNTTLEDLEIEEILLGK